MESPTSPLSPSLGRRSRGRNCATKFERTCCQIVTYFPLVFVYGLTSWAVWVEASTGFSSIQESWIGATSSFFGIALYILLNWSYTVAVFTDPGSTDASNHGGYSQLPVHESRSVSSFTVKSTGQTRYCKKCKARKPDRAHHCSTCKRCVLKMDHHCPWLATCLGLRNYKAFLLFLIYTTFFCWLCFAVSATWVWKEVLSNGKYTETFMPINLVLLAVISGIIGLVIAGFTGWHIHLARSGQTTIECLEKTRYLSPLRKSLQRQHHQQNLGNSSPSYGQRLREIHTNALPGITRPEEGEERRSPSGGMGGFDGQPPTALQSLGRNYSEMERSREHARHQEYLDEQDSEKLPNAFDLGWRRNLKHVFGPSPLLWALPICNTDGDGWSWEASEKWLEAHDKLRQEREQNRWNQENDLGWEDPTERQAPEIQRPPHHDSGPSRSLTHIQDEPLSRQYLTTSIGVSSVPITGRRSPLKAAQILGRAPDPYVDRDSNSGSSHGDVSMKTLRRSNHEDGAELDSEDGDDEETGLQRRDGGWGRRKLVGSAGKEVKSSSELDSSVQREGWQSWD
ncbi:MAG: palmitoyltransferase for Vac8p [Trizodia sp. TS-e1964]|nr:MAG: palmitoyltransferase for Vac8p [Trizodia sp. TS-e1964]